jgi:hypothetical protein
MNINYGELVQIVCESCEFKLDIGDDAAQKNTPASWNSWATELVIKRLDGPSSGPISSLHVVGIYSKDQPYRLDIGTDTMKRNTPASFESWATQLVIKRLDGKPNLGPVCYGDVVGIFGGDSRLDIGAVIDPAAPADKNTWATRFHILSNTDKWMSQLADETLLINLAIPGTHDSACVRGWGGTDILRTDNGKTQTLSIGEQLNLGVRFFDLRLATIGPICEAIHGEGALWHITFGQAEDIYWSPISSFLRLKPAETVFIHVACESGEELSPEHSDIFLNQFMSSPGLYLNMTSSTKLGEVRGKVVLLKSDVNFHRPSNFPEGAFGYDTGNQNKKLITEDHYVMGPLAFPTELELKASYIRANLDAAKAEYANISDVERRCFYRTFASAVSAENIFQGQNIKKIADYENTVVRDYFTRENLASHRVPGIVLLDYADMV